MAIPLLLWLLSIALLAQDFILMTMVVQMTLAPNIPNITVHAGAISFSIHPSITNVEEIEPVNLLNMLGVIGAHTHATLLATHSLGHVIESHSLNT